MAHHLAWLVIHGNGALSMHNGAKLFEIVLVDQRRQHRLRAMHQKPDIRMCVHRTQKPGDNHTGPFVSPHGIDGYDNIRVGSVSDGLGVRH